MLLDSVTAAEGGCASGDTVSVNVWSMLVPRSPVTRTSMGWAPRSAVLGRQKISPVCASMVIPVGALTRL